MRFKQILIIVFFLSTQLLFVDKIIIFAQEANKSMEINSMAEIEKQINQDRKDFKFTLKSNKEIYEVGEPIYIIGIWENNTNQDAVIKYPAYTFKFDTVSITDMTRQSPSYEFAYLNISGAVIKEEVLKPGQITQVKKELTLSFIFKSGHYSINVFMPSKDGTQHLIYIHIKE